MVYINDNYLKLQGSYLFSDIAKRIKIFNENNPEADLIRLGIGDVSKPLVNEVIKSLHLAVDEMSDEKTFKGYGPEQGYDFLRNAIKDNDYKLRGIDINIDEIFVSDGSKCDYGNIQEIFGVNNRIAITDPVYPVYIDTNVMAGRTGNIDKNGRFEGMVYLACNAENNFIPDLPEENVDIIYLCYPNNPTGMTLTKEQLKIWVEYAKKNKAIILYDAAYEAYIQEEDVPRSIYEIDGAKDVAIEFRSFSKTASFTGTRCAYTVVPKNLMAFAADGSEHSINQLWNRRQTTKFNGVPYIFKSSRSSLFKRGKRAGKGSYFLLYAKCKDNKDGLQSLGLEVYGGVNAPYIWLKTPNGLTSWQFFDKLLNEVHIVGTPSWIWTKW